MKTYERAAFRNKVLTLVAKSKWTGMTAKEVREQIGHHHGAVSGAMTILHSQDRLARLAEKTDNYRVYVLPEFVDGRETEEYVPRTKFCENCGSQV